ncbi:hypothetical protein [Streptomyces sp. NBC_00557]|uniref:hypothetical protein n=1 Tax=Streptomyces sp. NBC_00557 TaxID=2975776 RepID=UPI002E810858|nr:hypothetical protein [Streptomyces sp. NBC_00557]WUC33466.1 hypothetical protein OG956_04205 [Streptomyces sp. NBC_00557]
MGAESVPRREVVTARPRPAGHTTAPRPAPSPHPTSEAAASRLIRRQLRAALTATALLTLLLGLLPVLLRILPLADAAPRVPLAVWLLLGVAPYPALLAIGVWYVRRAERNETGTAVGTPAERP